VDKAKPPAYFSEAFPVFECLHPTQVRPWTSSRSPWQNWTDLSEFQA
jgi:hypothetical protein